MGAPLVLGLLIAATGTEPTAVVPFQIDTAPRLDRVFDDARALRAGVDAFLALQLDMERARDDFADAVHATLGELLPSLRERSPGRCPAAVLAAYARAQASGERFLAFGRRLDARFRELRRAEELGDTVALTPDYRWKIRRSHEVQAQLVRDFREMRVAFHDQLGAEMRHAGCAVATPPRPGARPADPASGPAPDALGGDILDETAWSGADPARPADGAADAADARGTTASRGHRPAAATAVAPPARIEIDNGGCGAPVRLSVDGAATAEIAAGRRGAVVTRSGPHELCLLPASDPRACGAPGTVRKAYLHDGWSLTVRCGH